MKNTKQRHKTEEEKVEKLNPDIYFHFNCAAHTDIGTH